MHGTCEGLGRSRATSSHAVLSADGMLVLLDRIGSVIKCVSGQLWITQENDSRDILLRSGQCFKLDRHGKTIVQAMPFANFNIYPEGK